MQIAVRILANTPPWVFALFAYLVWQGLQGLRPRTRPIWRTLIVPLVFFVWGLSRLVLARDHGLEPMVAWFVALILFAALGLSLKPKLLAVDRERGTATRPGSFGPLIRNITVFSLQYGVAVATAMKLEPRLAVAVIGHAVSGASAGYFAGWAAAFVRRTRNFDAVDDSGSRLPN